MVLLLVFILSLLAGFFLPWWIIALIAFFAAFVFGKTGLLSFWSGFLGVFSAWILLSLYKSLPNQNLLAQRVAKLFHLPNWVLLVLLTGLIGGLVGGMSALSGFLFKNILGNKR